MNRTSTDNSIYENQTYAAPKRVGELARLPRTHLPAKQFCASERSELVGFFADRINEARKGTKFKPLTYRAVGVKLSHLSTFDLYAFKSQALDYERRGGSFSAYFWSQLKAK